MRGSELTMSDVEALAAACAGGHAEKVEALLEKGASRTWTRVGRHPLGSPPAHQFPRPRRNPRGGPFF